MNRNDKDREEFSIFRKEYEIDVEKRKESDNTRVRQNFRRDNRSLV